MHVVLTYLSAINDQDTCMYQHSPVRENSTHAYKIKKGTPKKETLNMQHSMHATRCIIHQ
jgi:hypothetical protein